MSFTYNEIGEGEDLSRHDVLLRWSHQDSYQAGHVVYIIQPQCGGV